MPVWLAELAAKSNASDTVIGGLASVVLLACALGCLVGPLQQRPVIAAGMAVIVVSAAAVVPSFEIPALFIGGALVGLSLGVILALAVSGDPESDSSVRVFGQGLSFGCLVSFVILVGVSMAGLDILPPLAALAGLQLLVLLPGGPPQHARALPPINWTQDLQFLPFFILMGSYWAFLEIFALQRSLGTLSGWLAASLLLSAAGSFVASIARQQ
ncbi:MAG: hypothetical protein AAF408_14855, partial [Pseudomonadota bacterium]